jgi:uncharacterized protein YcfJ
MKQIYVVAALGLASAGAGAQEVVARVLSATPIVQQVAVPQQVCSQPMMMEPVTSGGGGLLGAIAGGAIGSQIGSGSGRGVATVLGVLGGAVLGNSIEANAARHAQAMPQCTTQTSYEHRTVGYNVTYEYAGYEYSVQMPNDPGPSVRLRLTPVGAIDPMPTAPQAAMPPPSGYPAPAGYPPAASYPAPVAYPPGAYPPPGYGYGYRPAPYAYPPIGISLGFGYVKHSR